MDRAALSPLLRSFERHLRAENCSQRTIASYLESIRQAETFLVARGGSLTTAGRADLEAFLGELLERRAAATVWTRYKALRILYRWLEEEDEIGVNPMARMRPPIVPEQPVPVVPEDGLRRLLATCAGKGFEDRRDTALILLLVDVGPRRAELMGLKVTDVDFDLDVLLVLGKGRRERALPIGRKSAVVLDRYLRVRGRHKDAGLPWLWLGKKGRLTEWGLVMMLRRRGQQAGLPGLYPHQLRHTFAHEWLAQGGNETDLMRLAGWKSRAMLQRYGASAADARAREAHRRILPVTGSSSEGFMAWQAGGSCFLLPPALTTSCPCPSTGSGRARSQRLSSPPWCSSGLRAPCRRQRPPWSPSGGCCVPRPFPPSRPGVAAGGGRRRNWCCNTPGGSPPPPSPGGRIPGPLERFPLYFPSARAGN
jgi:site-specific recombinase XerD